MLPGMGSAQRAAELIFSDKVHALLQYLAAKQEQLADRNGLLIRKGW